MKTALEKLKAVGILFLMIFACIGVVWVTNQFRGSPEYVRGNEKVLQVPVINEMDEEIIIPDSSVVEEVETDSSEGAEVLGLDDQLGLICGGSEYTHIKSESVCELDFSSQIRFVQKGLDDEFIGGESGSDLVAANAKLILAEVTVPLELLSGVEVYDSNRQITSDTPTLKPAGEQIDNKTANILLAPGQQIDEYKGWEEDIPFTFDYKTFFAKFFDISKPAEEGEVGVEQEIQNDCPHCNNQSNVNPDKSNNISEFMYDSLYRYPGQKDALVETEVMEKCEDDNFTMWHGEYEACKIGILADTVEFVKSISLWGQFLQLLNRVKCEYFGGDQECIEVEDIIVIMASPFGSDTDCLEGSACTNAFMDIRNKVVLAPDIDLGPKHYYLTPCKAWIQGKANKADIHCAWDMSHLFKERKNNEFNNLPNVESTPTEEEYQDFLEYTIQGSRDEAIPIQPGN